MNCDVNMNKSKMEQRFEKYMKQWLGQFIPWEMRSFGSTGGFFCDPFGKKGPYILIKIDWFQAKHRSRLERIPEYIHWVISEVCTDNLLLLWYEKNKLQYRLFSIFFAAVIEFK